MKIEIKNKDLAVLAEMVFLAELIINDERGNKPLKKYRRVKNQILGVYKSILSKEDYAVFSNEEKEYTYYLDRIDVFLHQYEAAVLIYTLSDKYESLLEINSNKNAALKIAKWRGDSRKLLRNFY